MRTARIEQRIGVSRVARITGLDRTGIEVASAVRPLGHVLQVSNGKGDTFAQARRAAVSEAAELWAAERVDVFALQYGSRRELVARVGRARVWSAAALGSAGGLVAPELWSDRTRIAWRPAQLLTGGPPVWIPAQAIHCPPAAAPPLGPAIIRWSSNGMGAHPRRERAIEHALLEALERDRLARVLPQGLSPRAISRRLLAPETLPEPLRGRIAALGERGFGVYFLELGNAPPCAAALLVDREEGPLPVTAGYACRRRPHDALSAALLEAAQSRLTDIHGARDDVMPADRGDMLRLAALLRGAPARRPFRVLRPFRGALGRGAAVVDLAPKGFGLHIVKVVVPALRVSELL